MGKYGIYTKVMEKNGISVHIGINAVTSRKKLIKLKAAKVREANRKKIKKKNLTLKKSDHEKN